MADANGNGNDASPSTSVMEIDGSEQDAVLAESNHLTKVEVLRRRHRRVSQLARVYRDVYWGLMEGVKTKYRAYYWKFGKSPFQVDEDRGMNDDGRTGESNNDNREENSWMPNRCAATNCKLKPMAMTMFCHMHVLLDHRQKLYKGCTFVVKSAPVGPILCSKPILRSTVPSLCPTHLQKAEKQVTRALKKAGLNVTSSNKLAPKFHVVVAEFVRQIQTKRRLAQKETVIKPQAEAESAS